MGLIMMTRPGIQVVCGTVQSAGREHVVIRNYCTVGTMQNIVQMRICTTESRLSRLNPKPGAFIFATIHPTDGTLALADGAYLPVTELVVTAYNIRYSGAFDFTASSSGEEEHVFCGAVLDKTLLNNGGTFLRVSWKHCGVEEVRNLYIPMDIRGRLGSRGVFATGRKMIGRDGMVAYQIKKIHAC